MDSIPQLEPGSCAASILQSPTLATTELASVQQNRRNEDRNKCIHDLFQEQVARTPDAVAVSCGDRELTYRELDDRSNQLAQELRKLRIGPETLVAVCLDRSPELIVGLLGILTAEKFIANPFGEGKTERLYRTGNLALIQRRSRPGVSDLVPERSAERRSAVQCGDTSFLRARPGGVCRTYREAVIGLSSVTASRSIRHILEASTTRSLTRIALIQYRPSNWSRWSYWLGTG